jgi:hypothetical protein
MITYGSLGLLPAVVRALGLRGSPEVWGARPVSGEDCSLHLLLSFAGVVATSAQLLRRRANAECGFARAAKALGI